MSNDMAAVIGVTSIFLILASLSAWAVWLYSRRRQERVRAELEVRRRMLEKFGNGEELTAFLASEGGRKFLEDLSTEHASHADKILASVKRGTILTLLGIGLWLLVGWERDLEPLGVFGTISLAIGLGYLGSAAVSYRFSKRWGLLPAESR